MDHSVSLPAGSVSNDTRNYGLDLLKALAMLLVVTLHVLGHGGILYGTKPLSAHYTLAWAMESLAYPAVDIYVIITGYLYAGRQARAKNIVGLWFQVFFYSVLIPIVLKLVGYDVDAGSLVRGFFPILSQRYWFFNAYFALFCFIPVLNALAENEPLLRRSLLVSLVLFSALPILGLGADLFAVKLGSSFLWFTVLYLSGAYIKRYDVPSFLKKHSFRLYFLCALLLLLSRLSLLYVTSRFMEKTQEDLFYSYASPLVYLAAVCMVLSFRNLSVPSAGMKKAVMLFSALSFDVYLIHDNPVFREHIIRDAFYSYSEKGLLMMAVYLLATILLIFAAGEAVGFCRAKLFAALRIRALSDRLGKAIDACVERIALRQI